MSAKAWILAGGFLLAAPTLAITPYLVKDIDPRTFANGSNPQGFVSLGGRVLLSSDTGIWASDGTSGGTVQLANERFSGFLAVGKKVAYAMEGDSFRFRLWVTDGTPGGTLPLTGSGTFLALPQRDYRGFLAPGTERLFFAASEGIRGGELWTSDGTAGGTRMVADLAPGSATSNPLSITSFRGRIVFVADDGRGASLWSVDAAGTNPQLIKDLDPQNRQLIPPSQLRVVGQTLYFFYRSATVGVFLWKSDGTGAGTVPVVKILPPTARLDAVRDAAVQLGRLFFIVNEPTRGRELWTSNGTAAGTRRLTDLVGSTAGTYDFIPLQQLPRKPLIFMAFDPAHGSEYWVSDGTPAGTRLLKDICVGTCSGLASYPLTIFRGRLYFLGHTLAQGDELWSTDGTGGGTRLLKDICSGACNGQALPLAASGARMFLTATEPQHGPQVWRTDGTAAGTSLLSSFPPLPSLASYEGAMAGSTLVFRGYDTTHGLELWRSGGTPETTTFLAALGLPLPASSSPEYIWPAGSRVVFLADDGVNGKDLWGSDGTDAGTLRLRPDEEPINFAVIFHAVSAEHLVYFVEFATGTQRGVLWRTDGTPSGTFPLTPPEVNVQSGRSDQTVVAHGDTCFFIGEDEAHGVELWTTDGTISGTHLVSDVEPGPASSFPHALDPFLGMYFFNNSGPTTSGTYVTDGTAAGTKRFDQAFPFLENFEILGVETGGKALLRKRPDAVHSELWTTDGTAAGTRLVLGNFGYLDEFSASGGYFLFKGGATFEEAGIYLSDGTPGGTVRIASDLRVSWFGLRAVAGRFVFSATRGGEGNHAVVWTTDGTPAGTRPLIETESEFLQPKIASSFAGKVLLTGGNRIWVTDGTPAGTSVLIALESEFIHTYPPAVAGDRAFFPLDTPETGNELWAFRPD